MTFFQLAAQNLLSPAVLFFALGLIATLARSDLSVPEAIGKFLAIYLLLSIGFRGGSEVAHHGLTSELVVAIVAGILLSLLTPLLAFVALKQFTRLDTTTAAAVSAHYGSISAVTFVAVTGALTQLGAIYDGYMIAVAAAMEAPAIFTALAIASLFGSSNLNSKKNLLPEIAANGSIVILVGAFFIGAMSGAKGAAALKPFIIDAFPGFLCLFLLDMGIVAGRGLMQGARALDARLGTFALLMPLVSAGIASAVVFALKMPAGTAAVFITLAASASYIAVPAAMRIALPNAHPSVGLTMSLGITFPFNLVFGIPLYIAAGRIFGT